MCRQPQSPLLTRGLGFRFQAGRHLMIGKPSCQSAARVVQHLRQKRSPYLYPSKPETQNLMCWLSWVLSVCVRLLFNFMPTTLVRVLITLPMQVKVTRHHLRGLPLKSTDAAFRAGAPPRSPSRPSPSVVANDPFRVAGQGHFLGYPESLNEGHFLQACKPSWISTHDVSSVCFDNRLGPVVGLYSLHLRFRFPYNPL